MKTGLFTLLLASILMIFNQNLRADIVIKVKGTGGIVITKNPDGSETTKICPKPDTKVCAEIVVEELADGSFGVLITKSQHIPVQIVKFGGTMERLSGAMQTLGSQLELLKIR